MNEALQQLSVTELEWLAKSLTTGKLTAEFTSAALQPYCAPAAAPSVARGLQQLVDEGWRGHQIATLLQAVAVERSAREKTTEAVELVWTGPECPGLVNRDTLVVVSELLAHAKRSVLVASYALYQGRNSSRIWPPKWMQTPICKCGYSSISPGRMGTPRLIR